MYRNTIFWKEYLIYINNYKSCKLKPKTPGEWIKFHRLQNGWSQMKLAIKLGLNENQGRYLIKDYETRGIYPSQELSIKLASLFKIKSKYFYDSYYEFLNINYSRLIKNYRNKNNLSKVKFAKLLNTSVENITRWEKGQVVSRKNYNKLKNIRNLAT